MKTYFTCFAFLIIIGFFINALVDCFQHEHVSMEELYIQSLREMK